MLHAGDPRNDSNARVGLGLPSPSLAIAPHLRSEMLRKVIAEMRAKAQGAQILLFGPSGFRLGWCSGGKNRVISARLDLDTLPLHDLLSL